jgi:hypothetical protein
MHWMPWSKDLYDTEQYESYCLSKPELAPLTVMLKESLILKKTTNNTPIASVEPGTYVHMDLRALGAGLYAFLNLPNAFSSAMRSQKVRMILRNHVRTLLHL